MGTESLAIPEENLKEVIMIIRRGLAQKIDDVSIEVQNQLNKWCDEYEEYIDDSLEEDKNARI
jgi:hypothetical protein